MCEPENLGVWVPLPRWAQNSGEAHGGLTARGWTWSVGLWEIEGACVCSSAKRIQLASVRRIGCDVRTVSDHIGRMGYRCFAKVERRRALSIKLKHWRVGLSLWYVGGDHITGTIATVHAEWRRMKLRAE
jgi:hypothetical protein